MNNLKIFFPLLLLFCSGCAFDKAYKPNADFYYLNPAKDLTNLGKATLVELANNSSFPQISSDATDAISQELQKIQIFSLNVVRKDDPAWRSLQLDQDATYNIEQLAAIRKTLKSDTIMVGTVTVYKPYPHLTVGLRLRLIDLSDGQLIWALEQIWDSTDKITEKRVKDYYADRNIIGFAESQDNLGIVSSLKFVKFAAYEIAQTMVSKR